MRHLTKIYGLLLVLVVWAAPAQAGYVANDPVNATDPTGMEIVCNHNEDGGADCSDSISGYETSLDSVTDADMARMNSFVDPGDLVSTFNAGFSGTNLIPNANGGNAFQSGLPGAGGQRYMYTSEGWVDLKHVGASMANGVLGNELGSLQEMTQGASSRGFAEDYLSNAIGDRAFVEMVGPGVTTPGDAVNSVMRNNFRATPITGEQFLRNVAPNVTGLSSQSMGQPIPVNRPVPTLGGVVMVPCNQC